jgi:hypothetical protein
MGAADITARFRVPGRSPGDGGSKPFLVVASDERQYWCKAPNNPQGGMVPVNEQVVGRLAVLAGIAVCEPALVNIPEDLAGIEICPGYVLEECVAHGSLAVDGAVEVRANLSHRSEDDNARRQAGYLVLHDWLWGGDDQWLRVAANGNEYFSHDHGHYFPGGPNWTVEGLEAAKDQPHPSPSTADGLDADELERLADRLDALKKEEIAAHVEVLPEAWPIGATEIAAIVDFAVHRAATVAARTRILATTARGT